MDVFVKIFVVILFLQELYNLMTFTHRAYDILVPDLIQHVIAHGCILPKRRGIRCLPDLHLMMSNRFVLRSEVDQPAIIKYCETITDDRCLHLLRDHIV